MPQTDMTPASMVESFGSPICYGLVKNMTYLDHAHPEYEMLFILEGQIEVFIAGLRYRLSCNSFLFIGSNTVHSYVAQPDSLVLVVGCDPEKVEQFTRIFQKSGEPPCLVLEPNPALRTIANALMNDPLVQRSRVALLGYTDLLLSHVAAAIRKQPPVLRSQPTALEQAIIQIDRILPENTSMEEIAQAVGISKFYLSRLFNQKLGVSFNTYLSLMQVNAARRMLVQTQLPIREIFMRCGYANVRSFDRTFLRIAGISPREYRKKNQSSHITDYDTPFVRELLLERHRAEKPITIQEPPPRRIPSKYE